MVNCAYCERPLTCDGCGVDYAPEDPDAYLKLSEADEAIACPACGEVLVCHWCKTPYDGRAEDEEPAGD